MSSLREAVTCRLQKYTHSEKEMKREAKINIEDMLKGWKHEMLLNFSVIISPAHKFNSLFHSTKWAKTGIKWEPLTKGHLFVKEDKSCLAFEWPPFKVQIEEIKDCLLS